MESREMYNATSHLTSLMMWDKEWIHFGTENEIKFDLLKSLIEDHLKDTELLFIHGRTTSGQVKKKEVINTIKPILGKNDFQLWTVCLDKVIQFKRIGVLNLGQIK